jgi:fluoride exporter
MPIGLLVALAGGLGAFSRYGLDYYAGDQLEPHHQVYVTFAANIVGSMLLGVLIGTHPDGRIRVVLGVGFLAAFTTFSTLVSQVYHAMDGGHYAVGTLLPFTSVILGVVTLWAGILAGRALVA